jgi:hypothetical protein
VLGAVVLVLALLAIPPMVMMSGMVAAALLDHVLTRDAEARYEGSELIDLYK